MCFNVTICEDLKERVVGNMIKIYTANYC